MGEMSELFLGFDAGDMFRRDLDAVLRNKPFVSEDVEEGGKYIPTLPSMSELYEPTDTPVLNRFKIGQTNFQKRKVKKVKNMAIDFSAFDQKVDLAALQKEVAEAKDTEFEDVPDGNYIVSIEKMEIKLTKAGDKLMFAVQCKIKEGEHQGRMIFFNRVIHGNKNSENWNDGKAIKSVTTWVNKLLEDGDNPVVFVNYQDFADQVLDVFQSVHKAIELEVDYKANGFNPISIKEVYNL